MKKLFILVFALNTATISFSQTTVLQNDFNTYAGTPATVQAGWYYSWNTAASTSGGPSFYSSAGYSGIAPNAYKFGKTNDTIISPVFSPADTLAFWCRGVGVPYKQQDTLDIFESPDSSNWSLLISKDSLPSAGTTLRYPLQTTTQYIMFVYHKPGVNGGNLAFDDVNVTSNANATSDVQLSASVNVFPAISQGVFTVQSAILDMKNIEIYGVTGQMILSKTLNSKLEMLNLEKEVTGIYFVKISAGSGVITRKIILSR